MTAFCYKKNKYKNINASFKGKRVMHIWMIVIILLHTYPLHPTLFGVV